MITLTPEETRQFGALFAQYDQQNSGSIAGDIAYPLFIKSELSTDQLRQIWSIADSDNNGFLDMQGFAKALRMIYHVQHGRPFSATLATIPAMVPNFAPQAQVTGASTGHSAGQPAAAVAQAPQSTGPQPTIPPLGTADKARFGTLFDKHARNDVIDGPSARDIFVKAKLSQDVLTKIWALVDVRKAGSLRRNEFILAMHLIQSSLNQSLPTIPSQLPAEWTPWLEGKATFIVTPEDKHKFDGHFDSLQTDGIIDAEKAAGFLTKSKLPEDVLAQVWDLADFEERGVLDRTGFAIAMFLVNRKIQGGELPAKTPQELIESASQPANGAKGGTAGFASPMVTGSSLNSARGLQSPASPPLASPRNAAPPAPQARSASGAVGAAAGVAAGVGTAAATGAHSKQVSGSMSDLMNLDDTYFGDIKSPVLSPTASGVPTSQAFVPKSSFGQSLVSGPSHAEVHKQHAETQKQHNEATAKLESTQALNKQTQADLKAVLAEKATLDEEINGLRSTYDQEAAQVYRAQQEIKALKEEMARLQKDHQLRKSGFSALETQHRELSTQLEQLRSQKDALSTEIAELETQHESHTRNIESLNGERAELEAQHSLHTDRSASLQLELQLLLEQVETVNHHRQTAETNLTEVRGHADAAEQQVAAARQELESARQQAAEQQRLHAEQEARLKAAQEQHQQIQQERQRLEQERQRLEQEQHEREQAEQARAAQQAVPAEPHAPLQPALSGYSSGAIGAAVGAVAGAVGAGAIAHDRSATPEAARSVPASASTEAPAHPATIAEAGPVGGISANEAEAYGYNIDTSPSTSYKEASTVSNRSSPHTSEFQMPGGTVPPSFTLPMARPQSATSSVQNNPPQSVRGDTEDVSVPVSPEFNTSEPVSGIVPPESLEINEPSKLYAHSGKSSDSFEFVDANDGVPVHPELPRENTIRPVQDVHEAPSSDDEGPEELPRMRGTAVYEQGSSITSAPGPTVSSPAHPSGATFSDRPVGTPVGAVGAAGATAAAPRNDDFGDAFDDLEEAAVSEDEQFGEEHAEPHAAPHTAPHGAPSYDAYPPTHAADSFSAPSTLAGGAQRAEPDEWQQLFSDTQPAPEKPLPAPPAHSDPAVQEAVQELVQMGFSESRALDALQKCDFNPSEAINMLLDD